MDQLITKFKDVVSNNAVRLNTLDIDRKYEIVKAEKVTTKYGLAILISIKENSFSTVKVFLPKRYSVVFDDDDIASINAKSITLYLVYKGTCTKSNSYILNLEQ